MDGERTTRGLVYTGSKGECMAGAGAKRRSEDRVKAGGTSRVIDIEEAQRIRKEKRISAAKTRKRVVAAETPVTDVAVGKSGAAVRWICLIAILLALLSMFLSGIRILDLRAEAAKAERLLALRTEEKTRLEKELAALNDPEYIEAQAREQLGMIKNDETLYVMEDEKESAGR
ncbi:MAG: septum formation initiator family protein [Clostridiales Family XIII bacterium]|nr:septum formation initiator family protein [Clostridiales Family XIII bacterium]